MTRKTAIVYRLLALSLLLAATSAARGEVECYAAFLVMGPFNAAIPACGSLDTQGQAAITCVKSFRFDSAEVKRVTPTSTSFEFRGVVTEMSSDVLAAQPFPWIRDIVAANPSVACPGPGSLIIQGEWNETLRLATEVAGIYVDDDFQVSASNINKCTDNPWVNQEVSCEQVGQLLPRHYGWPSPRPVTAGLMPFETKKGLVGQIEKRLAPEIIAPVKDQSISGGKLLFQARAWLPTSSAHLGNAELDIEVQKLGRIRITQNANVSINNRFFMHMFELAPGKYQVRARLSRPASSVWSKPVVFEITG